MTNTIAVIGIFAVALFVWSVFGGGLEKLNVTGPLLLAGAGLLAGPEVLGLLTSPGEEGTEVILTFAEITLALLLFSDAARLGLGAAIRDSKPALRLLALGLPLTILVGWGLGLLVLGELLFFEAAILAVILAPTDAALGKSVVESPRVPRRVRSALNIESGLNDGISVPFFTLFLVLAIEEGDAGAPSEWVLFLIEQIGFGVLAGIAVGVVGGTVLARSRARGWATVAGLNLVPLALALTAWAGADAIEGNGFIAAFIAGLVARRVKRDLEEENLNFADREGSLATSAVFFLFGYAALGPAIEDLSWEIALYAVLSLTLVRMIPVAISLGRMGFGPRTLAFVGWFGPRGLASIVLALTLVADREEVVGTDLILTVAAIAVGASILAHGVSSRPLARRYGESQEAREIRELQTEDEPSLPTRYESTSGSST
ncbi:MAG: cation:proton antiporter [Miltoncostaeaceae bacterium]